MALSFISNALGASNSTTSFSITLPTTVAGDILILEYVHRGNGAVTIGGTSITTGGLAWTSKHSQLFASGAYVGRTMWTRATGDHGGQTITGTSLTNSCAAIVTVYRGALAIGDPLADATIVGEDNASGNETQAQITTTTNSALVVLVVVNAPDVSVTSPACTSPGALTIRAERLSTGGLDTSVIHSSAEKATAGATGAFTWAQTNGVGGSWAYAIQPEPAAINLIITDNLHAHLSDSVAVTQIHILTVQENIHAHLSDNIVVVQNISLTVNDNIHGHIADGAIVVEQFAPAIDLYPNDNIHSHISDTLSITQIHIVGVGDNIHIHTADGANITQIHSLTVQENTHSHISDSTTITQIHLAAANDNIHGQLSDLVSITQIHSLSLDVNLHGHQSDNIALVQVHAAIIQDNLHSHLSDSPTITQVHILVIDANLHGHISDGTLVLDEIPQGSIDLFVGENIHSHLSDNASITQIHSLQVNDNLHAHLSDNVSATQIHSIGVQENIHSHISDSITIIQIHILSVNDNLHSHLSDNVIVTEGGAEVDLIANDNIHTHISDAFDITQVHNLLINDNLHSHISDSIVIESFAILSINDNVHGHISDHVTDIYVSTDLNHEIITGVTSFMLLVSVISYFSTTVSGEYLHAENIDGTYESTLDILGASDITDEILMQLIFR